MLALTQLQLLVGTFEIVQLCFAFAFGACIGSLINVLVYRLPLGLDVVTPTSRCPSCSTKLTWRENIPVFGWLMLRGRCRFCRSPISAEYPIVEAFVGLLFAFAYFMLYSHPEANLGFSLQALQPDWALNGLRETWPTYTIWVVLFASLVAVTLIDARTYQIPLILTWIPAAVGFLFHTGHAIWRAIEGGGFVVAKGWMWTIATPRADDWSLIGAGLGGMAGLLLSNLLLWAGVFRRSFADYEQWEKTALAQSNPAASTDPAPSTSGGPAASGVIASGSVGDAAQPDAPTDVWLQYPHARREMLRELVFVAPVIGLALLGSAIAMRAVSWAPDPITGIMHTSTRAPMWLLVLAGVSLGFLIGGGLVWAVRIFGSLAFGKEAMGLGDVHLMAAVGACLGWVDAVLGFFAATFVGLLWAILSQLGGGRFKRAMPFGPYLAVGTLLVVFCKPMFEKGLSLLFPHWAPINLP